jgi:NAD(P)-dependent dehydrogenase (short-subunit alcohol dehydrogenase family)
VKETPVALVTGGGRGIGAAIAVELARNGFDLVLFNRSGAGETAQQVEQLGRNALVVHGDVSSPEDRRSLMDQIATTFGRLDALVNNAGVAPEIRADLLEATEESYDRVMGINLKGPYFLTQAAANYMIARREDRPGWKCIINISSCSAYAASPSRGEYCLSKAAIAMATKLYAARLAEYGIGVYEIRPGIIETEMTSGVKEKYDRLIAEGLTPIRRWGTPEDVARAVAFCARGELKFSTGEVINVDGGFHLRTL